MSCPTVVVLLNLFGAYVTKSRLYGTRRISKTPPSQTPLRIP